MSICESSREAWDRLKKARQVAMLIAMGEEQIHLTQVQELQ